MKKFPVIYETKHWKVIIHEDQQYLGRCIISAQDRNHPNLTSLTDEEWLDFSHNVVQPLENAIKKAFGAELFNWSCLMNLAYQNTPPDPHVHWHVKPRYRNPVEFAGITFEDEAFGKHYTSGQPKNVDEPTMQLIADEINRCRE